MDSNLNSDILLVSTLEDENDGDFSAGDLSLREAIAIAEEGKTINFDPNLSGGTISLTLGELVIDKDLTIQGLGAKNLIIDGSFVGGEFPDFLRSRVFNIDDGDPNTVKNVTIAGLTITGGGQEVVNDGVGAGIFNQENLTLNSSIVDDNSSERNSGGGIANYGNLLLNSSVVSNNSAGFRSSGGGIFNVGTAQIINSTIIGNSSFNPGGGIANQGELTVANTTITNNDSGFFGDGISGSVTITSSIVAGNQGTDLSISGITSGGNNLIGNVGDETDLPDGVNGDLVGTADAPIDPLLGDLQDNGGATPTVALLDGSPAINGGSNPSGLTTDQRGDGFEREVGDATDIGAFEVQTTSDNSLLVSTLEDENDGDFSSGDLSLREAIAIAEDGATINFDANLSGGTISLALGELVIDQDLNIKGLGASNLTISGDNASRIFLVDDGDSDNLATVNIEDLTIADGNSLGISPLELNGGGFLNQENLTINNAALVSNSAGNGGAIYSSGQLQLTNSLVTESDGTGPLFNDGGTATVSNTTFTNHDVAGVGAIVNTNSSTLDLTNSTIVNNAGFDGVVFNGENSSATVTSTIIADNEGTLSPEFSDAVGTFVSGGNNLIGNNNGSIGFDNASDLVGTVDAPLDPVLGELQDNGGATATVALLDGSPAIDTGTNPNGLTTDQRGAGFDRTIGDGTDIGAFEVQTMSNDFLLVSTLEDENDGDFSAGDLSLREAIAIANEREGVDTISFDSGLNGNIVLTEGELSIEDSVIINGLGAANLTIDGNNSSRIFKIDDGNSEIEIDVAIDGLTITNGLVADEVAENLGGGVFNQENLTISNSIVTNNSAESNEGINAAQGGGIYTAGTLNLINSEVSGNSSDIFGGGIDSLGTTVNIIDSSINNNFAGFVGGGLHNIDTELNITNSNITGNVANFSLGGIDLIDSTGNISDSTISDNVAENAATGGIGINNSDVDISNSTVRDNSAQGDAGGIFVINSAIVDISNSTIANNSATENGGGINVGTTATVNITNTTISGNSAEVSGGGIFQTPGFVVGTPDGDLPIEGGIVNLESTIVAGNIGSDLGGEQINSNGNNLIGNADGVAVFNSLPGDLVGTAENTIDPGLGELANNGGTTATFALIDGSPAIDAGSNPNGLTTDQRGAGFDRTIGSGTDIGAFEAQTITSEPGSGTPGDDFLLGTEESDTINGLDGNDTIQGFDAADVLLGGNGNDSLDGGARNDSLDGGVGEDTLDGGNGQDTLDGGIGNDLLEAGASDDQLFGQDGDDTLLGETGRDTLDGGVGNDSLDGGTSDDLLLGFEGDDTLDGGNGRDTLDGGIGNDLLTGGNSNDTFVLSSGAGTDTITDFGRGNNVIGLGDGITFAELSFVGSDIILGTETLATLDGFDVTTLSESDFISI